MENIVVVSDMHVGEIRSIMPENFKLEGNNLWELTPAQKFLNKCWIEDLDKLPKDFILVLNGDLIQGIHESWFTKLSLTNYNDQEKAVIELLKPLAKKAKKTFVISGTDFHDQDYGDCEKRIAEAVGAEYVGKMLNLTLENNGNSKVINFCHGGGFSINPNARLERDMQNQAIAEYFNNFPKADTIVRSHLHRYAESTLGNKKAIITPCWQLPSDYIFGKANVMKMLPMIGSVLITFENGELNFKPLLHNIPHNFWNLVEAENVIIKTNKHKRNMTNIKKLQKIGRN